MDSIIISALLLMLTYKSKNRDLLVIAASGCVSSEALFILMGDVALYYSMLTMIATTLAYKAFIINSLPARLYSILTAINGVLCCLLIFSFSPKFNAFIESTIIMYNEYMLLIVFMVAVTGSDNLIMRAYNESKTKK